MAKLFWKSTSDAWRESDADNPVAPSDLELNEQHPLPLQLAWREDGTDEWHPVNSGYPLPVMLTAPVSSGLYVTEQVQVPGIVAAAIYAAGDAMGIMFSFDAPERGIIQGVKLIDLDDDTLAATLHVFSRAFTATADNAALSISADDTRAWVSSIAFTSPTDIGSGKVAEVTSWNSPYYAPGKRLYCQLSTGGTPTIAAGNSALVQLYILPAVGGA